MFHKLPPELLQIVLEYASVKCRNGEYISQLEKTDARYNILRTIPPIVFANDDNHYYYCVNLGKKACIKYFSEEYKIKYNVSSYKFRGHYTYNFYKIHENRQILVERRFIDLSGFILDSDFSRHYVIN
jgi:hypothetical protein